VTVVVLGLGLGLGSLVLANDAEAKMLADWPA